MIKPQIWALPAILAVFGLPFLLIGLAGIRTSLDTSSWASASGRVVVSRRSPASVKSAIIQTEFTVGATTHRCGVVQLGWTPTRQDMRDLPVGASAVVDYDPAQPARCALNVGIAPGSIAFALTGLLLPLFGIFLTSRRNSAVPQKTVLVWPQN